MTVGVDGGARLLLAKADGAEQAARIGDQTGGRVGFFLETDDFARDHARFLADGVRFLEAAARTSPTAPSRCSKIFTATGST